MILTELKQEILSEICQNWYQFGSLEDFKEWLDLYHPDFPEGEDVEFWNVIKVEKNPNDIDLFTEEVSN